MENKELLKYFKNIAHDYLKELDPAIGYQHMETTLDFAHQLAEKESADFFKCSICAILHDIGLSVNADMLNETIDDNHGIHSAKIAAPIMLEAGINNDDVNEICEAISTHTYVNMQKTFLAKILWDSDKLNIFSEKMMPLYISYWQKKGLSNIDAVKKIKQGADYFIETFYTQSAKNIALANYHIFN